jgi:predicted membrane protein
VTDLNLQTGMGATEVTLPAKAGHTRAKIHSGMGEVKVYVPEGVAARIHATGGMADVSVNDGRFPRSGDVYQSPNYDMSEHKVEIDAKSGMGALKTM